MEQLQTKIMNMDTDITEKFIVASCEDSLVRIFSIKEKEIKLITQLTGHSGVVTKALFINQGELIVSSDFNGKIIIWKLEGNQFVKKTEAKISEGPIYDMAVRHTADSFTLFCGCENGILKTVAFDSNMKYNVTEKEVHRYGIISVSCNTNYVATGGLDCSVGLISEEIEYFKHHKEAVNGVALAPSSDKEHTILATCSEDGVLSFIFKDGKTTRTQEISIGEPCYSVRWNRTGLVLTLGYGKGNFKSYIQGENGEYEEVPMEKK